MARPYYSRRAVSAYPLGAFFSVLLEHATTVELYGLWHTRRLRRWHCSRKDPFSKSAPHFRLYKYFRPCNGHHHHHHHHRCTRSRADVAIVLDTPIRREPKCLLQCQRRFGVSKWCMDDFWIFSDLGPEDGIPAVVILRDKNCYKTVHFHATGSKVRTSGEMNSLKPCCSAFNYGATCRS